MSLRNNTDDGIIGKVSDDLCDVGLSHAVLHDVFMQYQVRRTYCCNAKHGDMSSAQQWLRAEFGPCEELEPFGSRYLPDLGSFDPISR